LTHPSAAQSNNVKQFDCCSRCNSECKNILFLVHILVQMHNQGIDRVEINRVEFMQPPLALWFTLDCAMAAQSGTLL